MDMHSSPLSRRRGHKHGFFRSPVRMEEGTSMDCSSNGSTSPWEHYPWWPMISMQGSWMSHGCTSFCYPSARMNTSISDIQYWYVRLFWGKTTYSSDKEANINSIWQYRCIWCLPSVSYLPLSLTWGMAWPGHIPDGVPGDTFLPKSLPSHHCAHSWYF